MKNVLNFFSIAALSLSLYACGTGSYKEESFYVRGNCDMCKDRLETNVKKISGVAHVQYNVHEEELKVTYDTTKTNRTAIEEQCAGLGHGTKDHAMNEKNHEQLPECCKVSHNEGKH